MLAIKRVKLNFVRIAIAAFIICPSMVLSDHVPDNLAQELNPNFVGCMLAVDDAEFEFRDYLQSTCFKRMRDLCSGRQGIAPPSQVIDCMYFEQRRAIQFFTSTLPLLPKQVEMDSFFGRFYEKRVGRLKRDLKKLQEMPKPQNTEIALQQSALMIASVHILLWLARETDTSVEKYARSSFDNH